MTRMFEFILSTTISWIFVVLIIRAMDKCWDLFFGKDE